MNDTTSIYALRDPRSDEVRYIGKTDDPHRRWRRHKTEQGQTPRHKWLQTLQELGLEPILEIIEELPASKWAERERFWIAKYLDQGCNLVNLTAGGNGASGLSPSPETRAAISVSVKKEWEANPRTISEEHRKALSEGCRRAPRTKEWRAKIGEGNRGKRCSEQVRQKLRQIKLGYCWGSHTEETKAQLSKLKQGELNPMAKLIPNQVREIRQRYAAGGISLSALGREYKVDTRTISRIIRCEAWIHI